MKLVVKAWAVDREGVTFLRTADGEVSLLCDAETFERIIGDVDVREGDELTLDVSLIRRTRPERNA